MSNRGQAPRRNDLRGKMVPLSRNYINLQLVRRYINKSMGSTRTTFRLTMLVPHRGSNLRVSGRPELTAHELQRYLSARIQHHCALVELIVEMPESRELCLE